MDITPLIAKNANIIESYGTDNIIINKKTFKESIIVSTNNIYRWPVKSFEQININSFDCLQNMKPEIILLGCGFKHKNLSPNLLFSFREKNLYIDPMANGAVSRTYNVLLAEGRDVYAAFIL